MGNSIVGATRPKPEREGTLRRPGEKLQYNLGSDDGGYDLASGTSQQTLGAGYDTSFDPLPEIEGPSPFLGEGGLFGSGDLSSAGQMLAYSDARYTVQPGDNLSSIIGSSDPAAIGAVMRASGLSGSTIRPGQELILPAGGYSSGDVALGQGALNSDNARLAALRQPTSVDTGFYGSLGMPSYSASAGATDLYGAIKGASNPSFGITEVPQVEPRLFDAWFGGGMVGKIGGGIKPFFTIEATIDFGSATHSMFDWYGKPNINQEFSLKVDFKDVTLSAGVSRSGDSWNKLSPWNWTFGSEPVQYQDNGLKLVMDNAVLFRFGASLDLARTYDKVVDLTSRKVIEPFMNDLSK